MRTAESSQIHKVNALSYTACDTHTRTVYTDSAGEHSLLALRRCTESGRGSLKQQPVTQASAAARGKQMSAECSKNASVTNLQNQV